MAEVALKKFTHEKGLSETGRLLGCTAPAIIKAIKSGRNIAVQALPDGSYSAEERRPFPATAKKAS